MRRWLGPLQSAGSFRTTGACHSNTSWTLGRALGFEILRLGEDLRGDCGMDRNVMDLRVEGLGVQGNFWKQIPVFLPCQL